MKRLVAFYSPQKCTNLNIALSVLPPNPEAIGPSNVQLPLVVRTAADLAALRANPRATWLLEPTFPVRWLSGFDVSRR